MSQKKDENESNQNSFEYEDRISNVIITPKNKDILNSNKQLKNSEKEPKAKNSYTTINYNSINNKNIEEQNNTTNKTNGINFSNAEMEFLNGMKTQLGYSESQNLNGMDQQKLFETFLMFQKFLSNQAANNNDDRNNNNVNTIAANQNENFNNFHIENNNKKANGNPNVNLNISKGEDRDINSVPPDYIHQRKKNKGTLSNSNIVNEFKRSSTNNFSTSDQAVSLEKNQANTIMKDEVKFNSNNETTYNKNNNNVYNTLNIKNAYEQSDNTKNLNGTNEEKSLNTKEINHNSNNNLNYSVNNKIGFNRLKNRNKSTSIEFDLEKEKNENYENNIENRNTLEQKSSKADLPSNTEIQKIKRGENKAIECTPSKDIEFSNRSSFDVKKENLPSNCENFSAKKPEINQTNKNGFNNPLSNKISDDKNSNSLMNNESDTLIKKLDSNDSLKKFNDEVSANKNNKKNLNKKLNEEDFMPKKDALLSSYGNKNKSATENTSRVDNFDDIPIKSSHTNFLELFEKNLAAEEGNIYGTISNDYTANTNSEIKKPAVSRRNNPRVKKEINISAPSKEAKKYKYYSDNFEEKLNEGVNENENHNEKISFGNYMTENPNNPKNRVANGNINKNKKGVNNKSVEKTGGRRLDPAAKTQEDKSFNLNLNGNLSGSTHIPNGKGKYASSNKSKNTKNNPLSASVNYSENLSMKEKEKENNSNNKNAQQPQQKQNAEASLKNLKNNILNKKLNKGLEQDSTSSTKAEPGSDKLQTLKNYKEFADIPEIKSLIQNNSNSNSNSNSHNTKVAFHSGDKNLITFGTTNRDSFGQQNPLNKNSSTPQFTIGFNAPYLNQPNATEKNSDENKVTKLIKSLLPFNTNEDDAIEENFTNENESPVKIQKGKSSDNKEDAKAKEANDDQFDFFNDINKKINDRINLPISKEISQHASKKTLDSNKSKNIKETSEAPNKQNSINTSKKDPVFEPNSIINQTKGQKEELYGEKLKELEQEIQQLKAEKESVSDLKQEYQRLYAELNEEIDNFYLKKDSELKEFEKWKEEETRKILKEKKASEAKSGRLNQNIIPSKKDKEEIECLKNIIAKMQEEFKIKDNNNRLTIEKLKRKLEESNSKVTELSKVIEDLNTQKNVLMRSNSTNLIKVNNANYPNLAAGSSNSSINLNSNNKRTINYNDANSINNINNNSTHISPSTQGLLSRNTEEHLNSNKTNKSINFQLNSASSGNANNLINNFNLNPNTINNSNNNVNNAQEINKQRVNNAQRNSEDLNKLTGKQILMKKDSKEIFGKSINNNNTNINNNNNNNYHSNLNNKSVELVKKRSSESEINIKTKIQNYSPGTNIISDPNLLYNPSDDGVYDLVFLEQYHPRNDLKASVLKHENFPDGKIVKFYDNDKREVIFPSGVRKEIFSDGYQIVYFNNKDIKQVFPNGKQIYFFSEAKTIQTTFPDNLQVFKFENGQIEKHYGEGCKQIIFPDGTQKVLFEDENIDDKNVN